MDSIEKNLLAEISDLHSVPEGAYNIRNNGKLEARNTTANIDIVTKKDKPGIDIYVKPGTKKYLAACIFFAMTASIAIRNRETCMLIFVFTSVPLLFISGISWPGAAIPPFWKYVSYIFPSTFGINGFVKINNMGATLSEVAFEYKALWLQAGIYFLTTCWVYRWQILMSRKHAIERYKELKEKANLS